MSEQGGGAGELTAEQSDWVTYAAKALETQYQWYGTDWTLLARALWPWIERRLAEKAPQGVPACEYCEALWERDEKTMKHRHPDGFGGFAYKCEAAAPKPAPAKEEN